MWWWEEKRVRKVKVFLFLFKALTLQSWFVPSFLGAQLFVRVFSLLLWKQISYNRSHGAYLRMCS